LQISDVLSIHELYSNEVSNRELVHADILGDAFLLQKNLVYRKIKKQALDIGCTYTEAWTEYLLMPFQQLKDIVADKKIPYVPSAKLLRSIERQREGMLAVDDLAIPESYHLHEAAHVIAEDCFRNAELNRTEEKILKAIICESFANTVDALACAYVDDEVHEFFLKQNCYMHPDRKYIRLMSGLNQRHGPRFVFILTLFGYLHANFLKEGISKVFLKRLIAESLPGIKISEKIQSESEALIKMAAKLDPQFRVQTTQVYLNLEGYGGDVHKVLDFDFIKVFSENPQFSKASEAMGDLLLG
jgi:hypothetical protein